MILDFDILTWSVGIVLLLVVLMVLWKRSYNFPRLFFLSAFWIYPLLVLKIAVFPIPVARGVSTETVDEMMPIMLSTINFRLFFFGQYATFASILVTILQNLILTMPLGFGINFIKSFQPRDIVWLALLIGFGMEALQFIVALLGVFIGMWRPDHIVDINDALLNFTGMLIGYWLFRFLASWYAPIQHPIKTKQFFAYLQEVSNQPE